MENINADNIYDVIILGAGASGLQCALTASERKLRVLLLDHNTSAGRKIAVSGGGKANFTNLHMGSAYYHGEDVSFVEPCLDAFPPKKILDFYIKHGLLWEEREHGQLFGLHTAQKLVNAFCQDCEDLGCEFLYNHSIQSVHRTEDIFIIHCSDKDQKEKTFFAKSLVLALGSPAWPQVGASSMGLALAAQFGHKTKPFQAALAPLIMPKSWELAHLSGIALPVRICIAGAHINEALLFTHNGISGPAVLQASCYFNEVLHGNTVQSFEIDFLPHLHLETFLDAPECAKLFLRNLVNRHMPERLADALLPEDIARRKIAELSRKSRQKAHQCVHNYKIFPLKKDTMSKAEAALGGVYTQDINAWSMESLLTKKLFITGELLDITGHLGGYNLHFAFASGYLAGLNV